MKFSIYLFIITADVSLEPIEFKLWLRLKVAAALFCCAIDWLMRHCSGCFGVDVGNFHLTGINYADDAVLFTDDPTKWDYVFRNFEASAAVMGLVM